MAVPKPDPAERYTITLTRIAPRMDYMGKRGHEIRGHRMRATTITRKIKTNFGNVYIHIDLDPENGYRPCGGSISTPGKEPESQIVTLVETISAGLDEALRIAERSS